MKYKQRRADQQDQEGSSAQACWVYGALVGVAIALVLVKNPQCVTEAIQLGLKLALIGLVTGGMVRLFGREKLQSLLNSKVGIAIVILLCAAVIWGKKHGKEWAQPRELWFNNSVECHALPHQVPSRYSKVEGANS